MRREICDFEKFQSLISCLPSHFSSTISGLSDLISYFAASNFDEPDT